LHASNENRSEDVRHTWLPTSDVIDSTGIIVGLSVIKRMLITHGRRHARVIDRF